MSEKLTELFAPKFQDILGKDLKDVYFDTRKKEYNVVYTPSGQRRSLEEIRKLIDTELVGKELSIQVVVTKDPKANNLANQYPDLARVSVRIVLGNNQIVAELFGCNIQGTQYNCGMKEVNHITALGCHAGAGKGLHTEQGYAAIYLGFDLIYELLTKYSSTDYFAYTKYTGVLVMSHDEESFVTKVARKHPMWQELLVASNPIYGGEAHKFVMFAANIDNQYGERLKREKIEAAAAYVY